MFANTMRLWIGAAAVTALCAVAVQAVEVEGGREIKTEAEWIQILNSDADLKLKFDACRGLAIVGGEKAVPSLAKLLGDAKMSNMALYALQEMEAPSVNPALRKALGQTEGLIRIGIIGTIGYRGDAEAIEALSALLALDDLPTVQATARALGSIGGDKAARILEAQIGKAPEAARLDVFEGLFRCAESMVAAGDSEKARGIYDRLRSVDSPHQVRSGALYAAILLRGPEDTALLTESLKSQDPILFSGAMRAAMDLPEPKGRKGSVVVPLLRDALKGASADRQVSIAQILARRRRPMACDVLVAMATDAGAYPVVARIAALQALPQLNVPSKAKAIAESLKGLLKDPEGPVAQAALAALGALRGRVANQTARGLLNEEDETLRRAGIELCGRRRIVAAVPQLITVATDERAAVRQAALKMVGELGRPQDLKATVALFEKLEDGADLETAAQTLINICAQCESADESIGTVSAAFGKASATHDQALPRVYAAVGGPAALKATQEAVKSSDAETRKAAIRALGAWKTPDAIDDLLKLARTTSDNTEKVIATRGVINMMRSGDLPVERKIELAREAAQLVPDRQGKIFLLGALGEIAAAPALKMAMTFVKDAEIQNEAAFAALKIAEKIVQSAPAETREAMNTIIETSQNDEAKRQAREILGKIK